VNDTVFELGEVPYDTHFFASRQRSKCTLFSILKSTTMPTRNLLEQPIDFFLLNYSQIHHHHHDNLSRRSSLISVPPSPITSPNTVARTAASHCRRATSCRQTAATWALLSILCLSIFHGVTPKKHPVEQGYPNNASLLKPPWPPPPPPWENARDNITRRQQTPNHATSPAQHNDTPRNQMPDTQQGTTEKFSQMTHHLGLGHLLSVSLLCLEESEERISQLLPTSAQLTQQHAEATIARSTWVGKEVPFGQQPAAVILLQNTSSFSYFGLVTNPTMPTCPSRKAPSSLLLATKASSAHCASSRLASKSNH